MSEPIISLQTELVKKSVLSSVLAGILSFVILLAISSYQAMQIQDEIMDEISDILIRGEVNANHGGQLDELSDEFKIQYQLLMHNAVMTSSAEYNLPQRLGVQQQAQGYGFFWHDQHLWRSYVQKEAELGTFLAQPLKVRFGDVLQSAVLYCAILWVLWLVQWGVVHLLIKKQLSQIHRLSQQISAKNAQDLKPIEQELPVLQELQPMVTQLNNMLIRVEQALVSEQRFTADASHELRSPLSAINMRLQVLKRQYPQDQKLQQAMLQIQQDINRGTQILENLLFLARLDPTDSAQLPKENINLKDLLTAVIDILAPLAEQKNIQWQLQLSDLCLEVNAELLLSCLRNLIDNAIRYQQQNGNIYIRLEQVGDAIQICIEDDGKHLTEDVLEKMGERFYRALGTKTQGSGLGLSICKKIIDLHQGKIHFSCSEFGGLKVTMTLFI